MPVRSISIYPRSELAKDADGHLWEIIWNLGLDASRNPGE
jgi:hypothetical protein